MQGIERIFHDLHGHISDNRMYQSVLATDSSDDSHLHQDQG